MSKTKRGWLIVASALAVGASGIAWADDAGDNGMNPMVGDSYAVLQGRGHNIGTPQMAPQGAYAAHEMDSQPASPLVERMQQTQRTMAEQTRRNWDAMVEKTHAMTGMMHTAMNTQSPSTSANDQAPATGKAATANESTPSTPRVTAPSAPNAPKGMTGTTSAPSASGQVVASPPPDIGQPMVATPAQPATDSGYKIAPVNPRGQAPTVVGPGGG